MVDNGRVNTLVSYFTYEQRYTLNSNCNNTTDNSNHQLEWHRINL